MLSLFCLTAFAVSIATLNWVFATLVSPVLTQYFKQWQWADHLSTTVNTLICIVLYAGGWWLGGHDLTNFQEWILAALSAAGVSTTGYNAIKGGVKVANKGYDI